MLQLLVINQSTKKRLFVFLGPKSSLMQPSVHSLLNRNFLIDCKNASHHLPSFSYASCCPCLLSDKVELTSNGLENNRGVSLHTPPPPSPSGRSPAASSSSSSPSPGQQEALGPAASVEPSSNTTSSTEQASNSTTEPTTDSLPAG